MTSQVVQIANYAYMRIFRAQRVKTEKHFIVRLILTRDQGPSWELFHVCQGLRCFQPPNEDF